MARRQMWGSTNQDVSLAYADVTTRMLLPNEGYTQDGAPALLTGKCTHFRTWVVGAGNQKAGIWNAAFDTLLAQRENSYAVSAGWNYIPLDTALDLVASTDYIAGAKGDVSDATGRRQTEDFYSYRYTAGYSDAFVDDISGGTVTDAYEPLVQLWGYTAPVLTSINGGSSVADEDTNVSVVGTDFIDSDGDPKLYLSPTSTFSLATAVEQTVTGTTTDTAITATIVQGSLSVGTVYGHVVSALDQVSNAVAVTLTGDTPTNPFIDIMLGFNF